VRKCPYCDFNSHALRGQLPEQRYVQALLQDLSMEAPRAQGRELQSIFLGGGTPSLLSERAMAQLLEGCARLLPLAADIEITLEANPGTIEHGRFAGYRAAGINRVSLGAQSFSDEQLQRLGRIHAAADTQRAVAELRDAGLSNFNLDLMYGLPQQTLAAAVADIDAALALAPAHVSYYQLTLEPGTLFAAQPPADLPDTDSGADMQRACQERLAAAGLAQYEVSAYAQPGARCRHNLNYWEFGDYLGIGAGAHGKCTRMAPQGERDAGEGGGSSAPHLAIERSAKWREPRRYLAAIHTPGAQPRLQPQAQAPQAVAAEQLPFEYLMNALRLTAGFEQQQFEHRTGLAFAQLAPQLTRLASRGLIEQRGDRWRASARGFDLLNELLAEFLPTPPTLGRV
jgi:oxygen-independent coproporphyrinogen-3 oxidase